jgi:hypothetical protein
MFQDDISLTLESAIDTCGLESVLMRLADIASGKAEHTASNWQDLRLSRAWDKTAGIMQRIADKIPEQCK